MYTAEAGPVPAEMSPSLRSRRTLAVLALLAVGLACSFAFNVAVSGEGVTYTATAVEPGENASLVARASPAVADLGPRLDDVPPADRDPVRAAAENGTFEGIVAPELHIAIDDIEARYVVYEGRYYAWNATWEGETTNLSLRMRPTAAAAVLGNVSEPYAGAPAAARTAIERGSVTGESGARGIYLRDGAYYAVTPPSDDAILSTVLGALVGFVLTTVGRGYVAVGLGLLAFRYREPSVDRPLTVRRALGVAALGVPVGLLGTLLFESGSASRFVTAPTGAFVVACGVVAGVLAKQGRWPALAGFSVLVAVAAAVAVGLAMGVVGLVFAVPALLVGFLAGTVPLVYGRVFGRD